MKLQFVAICEMSTFFTAGSVLPAEGVRHVSQAAVADATMLLTHEESWSAKRRSKVAGHWH